MVEHDWRRGHPVKTIARLYRLTESQVVYRMRDVPRAPLPQQRPSKYPRLNDASWLRVEIALGITVAEIARRAGCGQRLVVAALRRHEVTVPPRRIPRLERVALLTNPDERARAAERIIADATAEARAARRIRAAALRRVW